MTTDFIRNNLAFFIVSHHTKFLFYGLSVYSIFNSLPMKQPNPAGILLLLAVFNSSKFTIIISISLCFWRWKRCQLANSLKLKKVSQSNSRLICQWNFYTPKFSRRNSPIACPRNFKNLSENAFPGWKLCQAEFANCVHESVSSCRLCQIVNERFGQDSLNKTGISQTVKP